MRDHSGVEAHSVVALAAGTVRDGVRPLLVGDFHQALADEWAPERRRHQVATFVGGVGA